MHSTGWLNLVAAGSLVGSDGGCCCLRTRWLRCRPGAPWQHVRDRPHAHHAGHHIARRSSGGILRLKQMAYNLHFGTLGVINAGTGRGEAAARANATNRTSGCTRTYP
jgi:hypothetical protein